MAKKTCAHDACSCRHEQEDMIRKDSAYYCSVHCSERDPAPGETTHCGCGHPDCSAG